MSQDLNARLVQLDTEKIQHAEQLTSLTEQLSLAKQEAELANRLLEESRTQVEQMKNQQHTEDKKVLYDSSSMLIHMSVCEGTFVELVL